MIAKCAKLIVEKDGSIRRAPDDEYEGSYADFDYVDTPDGFRYIYHKGEYTMIAYLGGEDTVTLPEKVNGKSYNIRQLCGVKKVVLPEGVEAIYNQAFAYNPLLETVILPDSLRVIWSDAFAGSGLMYLDIPEGVEQIGNYAFAACFRLKSIELPEGIKIVGAWAFSNCISLESVVMPDSIVEIGESCFRHSKFYHDRSNWTDGSLYVGSNLIEADTNAIVFKVPENVTCIAYGAFDECYRLREIEIGNAPEGILMNMTNLETLVIYKMPEGGVREYFTRYGIMNVPITLKDVVLSEGVRMVEDAFSYIQNVNIFVDQLEKDTMWDENFPGWNNHNRVSYSDKWMVAKFYDGNGELIHKEVFLTSQVVRQPWVSDRVDGNLTYVFVGYDLDGDGVADFIPATSTSDILATAVFQSYDTCELNGHTEGDWIIEIEANCVQTGVQKKYCTVCLEEIDSREYTEIKHRESDWMNDGDYLYIECLDCHERFEEIYIGNGGGDSGNEGGGDSGNEGGSNSGNEGGGNSGNEGGGNSGNEGGGNKPSVSKPIQSESKPESKPEPQPEPNEDPVDGGNNDTNDGDSTLIIIIVSALAVALATAVVVIIVIKKKK